MKGGLASRIYSEECKFTAICSSSGCSRDNFAPIIQYNSGEANKLWYFDKQTANAMTRNASGSEGNVTSDMSEPMDFCRLQK